MLRTSAGEDWESSRGEETSTRFPSLAEQTSPQAGFRGAHRPELMRAPDLAVFDRLQKAACGRIKLVTLAPEWEGSAR